MNTGIQLRGPERRATFVRARLIIIIVTRNNVIYYCTCVYNIIRGESGERAAVLKRCRVHVIKNNKKNVYDKYNIVLYTAVNVPQCPTQYAEYAFSCACVPSSV